MKKYILFILLLCSTTIYAQKGFKIKGNIKGLGDCKMTFNNISADNSWLSDTIDVKNGKFIYKGKVDYPALYTIMVSECSNIKGGFFHSSLFIENSSIKINGDLNNSVKTLTIRGSKTNEEYDKLNKILEEYSKKIRKAQYESSTAFKNGDKAKCSKADMEKENALKDFKDCLLSQSNYKTSLVIPYIVERNFSTTSQYMPELLAGFGEGLNNHPYVKYLKDDWSREQLIKEGNMAFDFELEDYDGKKYRLSDYRGKYVYLEFSASW